MLLDIRKVSHQKQISKNSCVAACVAMVAGDKQEDVIKEMELDGFEMPFCSESALRYLCRKNIHMEMVNGTTRVGLMQDIIYLASCPSSAGPKSAHMIVLLTNENGVQVLDPADNLESEKIYSSYNFSNGEIPIFCYYILTDCSNDK